MESCANGIKRQRGRISCFQVLKCRKKCANATNASQTLLPVLIWKSYGHHSDP